MSYEEVYENTVKLTKADFSKSFAKASQAFTMFCFYWYGQMVQGHPELFCFEQLILKEGANPHDADGYYAVNVLNDPKRRDEYIAKKQAKFATAYGKDVKITKKGTFLNKSPAISEWEARDIWRVKESKNTDKDTEHFLSKSYLKNALPLEEILFEHLKRFAKEHIINNYKQVQLTGWYLHTGKELPSNISLILDFCSNHTERFYCPGNHTVIQKF